MCEVGSYRVYLYVSASRTAFLWIDCLLIYTPSSSFLFPTSSFLRPPYSFLLLHSSFLYLRRPLFRCIPWSLPQCHDRCVSIKPFNKPWNTLMIIFHIFHNTQTRRHRVTHRVHLQHTYSTYRVLTRTYSTPYTRLYFLPSYLLTILPFLPTSLHYFQHTMTGGITVVY